MAVGGYTTSSSDSISHIAMLGELVLAPFWRHPG